jgi:Raf kinase inhibitor-like YbhB/YbcL family protein
MVRNLTRVYLSIVSAVLSLAGPAKAADAQRGRLLYEDHCIACHESRLHTRTRTKVHYPGELKYQISRWARVQHLAWTAEEVDDVYGYLTRAYYRFIPQKGGPAMSFSLASSAFDDQGPIPAKHSCQGEDISPALTWSGIPPGTKSLALIVDDPDAPDPRAPKMTWVHWVLYNIPPQTQDLPEAVAPSDLPPKTLEGLNDWKRTGYGGPCPPIGRHRYFHKLYALDTVLPDLGTPTKAQLETAMQGHILAETELMGTYEKGQ